MAKLGIEFHLFQTSVWKQSRTYEATVDQFVYCIVEIGFAFLLIKCGSPYRLI